MEKKKNNQLVNLAFNIIIPILILTKLSTDEYLGPLWGLIIALAFPLGYGLYELVVEKEKNFISVIGFVGVLLTGIIGLFKFPPQWIAIKEGAIPLFIGILVLVSTKTSWQVIRKILYNKELLNIDQIESSLVTAQAKAQLQTIFNRANVFLAISFLFSATLNFILAKIIVQSMPGTAAFNAEIGKMTMLSFPVIALPSMIILLFVVWYIFSALKKLTQLTTNEILSSQFAKK